MYMKSCNGLPCTNTQTRMSQYSGFGLASNILAVPTPWPKEEPVHKDNLALPKYKGTITTT